MKRTRLGALLALCCALALGVAACGEDDDTAFMEEYNQAVRPLSELGADVGSSLRGVGERSNDRIAQEFDRLADKAREARDNLAQIDPPEDAEQPFQALLTALQRGAGDLRAVATAAEEDDPAAAQEASQELRDSGTAIRRAETELQRAVGR